MKDSLTLAQELKNEVDYESVRRHLLALNELERYSGSEAGEASVKYIIDRLRETGAELLTETYDLYRSLPLSGRVTACGRAMESMPVVYSACARGLTAPLVYDEMSEKGPCAQRDMQARCRDFTGNIVVTHDKSFDFARAAARAGAVGIITVWKADLLHHGTLGGVWGNPEPEELLTRYPMIPYTELGKSDGMWLIEQIEKGGAEATLDIEMDNGVVTSTQAVCEIKGESDMFVLVSGHYDSWHVGITDNGVANAFMIELARMLANHREDLKRTVRLAWWSGHSDGRYAGSTAYFDRHFAELREKCVAHLNMDICGCKGSDIVAFNTSMLEGREFSESFLCEYNAAEPLAPVPMGRFADQTFWGADVPFAIMPKFTVTGFESMPFYASSWWHTVEDTLDKVDPEIAVRDGKVMAHLTALFANAEELPARYVEYADWMKATLDEISGRLAPEFDIKPIFPVLAELRRELCEIESRLPRPSERAQKHIGGTLTRLVYSASDPYGQDQAIDRGLFPGINIASGLTRDNTTPEYFLAAQTRFTRALNRLVTELGELSDYCKRINGGDILPR